jgi:hypothetical protein
MTSGFSRIGTRVYPVPILRLLGCSSPDPTLMTSMQSHPAAPVSTRVEERVCTGSPLNTHGLGSTDWHHVQQQPANRETNRQGTLADYLCVVRRLVQPRSTPAATPHKITIEDCIRGFGE